jgi:anti-sigma28 factor (negative regulator of flagellin synthesis)
MNVFDWLSDLDVPQFQRFHVVEVKFKGGRKEYLRNANQLHLHTGDSVMVESTSGIHLGVVSLQGELVRLQMLKKSIKDGTYQVESSKIADRLVDEHMRTDFGKNLL